MHDLSCPGARRLPFGRHALARYLSVKVCAPINCGLGFGPLLHGYVEYWFAAAGLRLRAPGQPGRAAQVERCGTNLVDPASSHMLVSKIKPCMSQYKLLYGETANGSLKQLQFI